jgi:hypothetical protein
MDYIEALKYSNTVKWKISFCGQGENCWCRVIEPEIEIKDDKGNEIYIAGSGSVSLEHAEHIVKIHNDSLNEKQQYGTKCNICGSIMLNVGINNMQCSNCLNTYNNI